MKSALIGVVGALLVVFVQNEQQRKKEDYTSTLTKQNKMKYLNFLVQDTYKIVEFYNSNTQVMDSVFKQNPFKIVPPRIYSTQSLNIIVNKLNQEEYYLVSINQLKRNNMAQAFLYYNALLFQITEGRQKHKQDTEQLITMHSLLGDQLNILQEKVNQLIQLSPTLLIKSDRAVQKKVNAFWIDKGPTLTSPQSPDERFQKAMEAFITPVITILESYGDHNGPLRDVLMQAYSAKHAYQRCVSLMAQIVHYNRTNGQEINYEYRELKELTQPLENYVSRLPEANK